MQNSYDKGPSKLLANKEHTPANTVLQQSILQSPASLLKSLGQSL